MNAPSFVLFLVLAIALWTVPRKLALAPFLVGCCLVTTGQGLHLGFITLPIYRMLMLIGVIRVLVKGERIVGGINLIDRLMMLWAGWYLFSSMFHDWKLDAGPVYVCGVIYNQLVFYFLVRTWCSDLDDTVGVIKTVALVLVPVALEMLLEKATGKNLFSFFGGVPETVMVREGKLRAQGPFLHPILAGTVGATCIPLFVGLLRDSRFHAVVGIVAGLVMVFASASSGPVMSFMAAVGALIMWRYRHLTKAVRRCAVILYLILMVTMERPPYYLISKIDLSGGSTGWHRSFLIDQTINHFSEWWLFGTDHTRHWMPNQGVASSPTHTDITNYYISYAIGGGLPGLMVFLFILGVSFRWVGQLEEHMMEQRPHHAFMIWCFGSALFAHAVTGISVAYFDQSVVFLWLNVAVIASVYSAVVADEEEAKNVPEAVPSSIA